MYGVWENFVVSGFFASLLEGKRERDDEQGIVMYVWMYRCGPGRVMGRVEVNWAKNYVEIRPKLILGIGF